MTKKIDIFSVLDKLNKKEDILLNLNEEEIKQIQPFVLMRWLTGCINAKQIYFLNELVNPYVFHLSKHKGLLTKLLTICTFGKSQRYKWIPPISDNRNFPNISQLIMKAYECNNKEVLNIISMLSNDDIMDIAIDMGYQQEEITKIKKELKLRESNSKSSV